MLIPASIRDNRRIGFPYTVGNAMDLDDPRSGYIYWHHFCDDYLVIHTDAIDHDDYQLVHEHDPKQYSTKIYEDDGAIHPPGSINDTLKEELSRRYDTVTDFLYDWTDMESDADIEHIWDQNTGYFDSRDQFDEVLGKEVTPTAFYLTIKGIEPQDITPVFILTQDQIGALLNERLITNVAVEKIIGDERLLALIGRSDVEFVGIKKDMEELVDVLQDTRTGSLMFQFG